MLSDQAEPKATPKTPLLSIPDALALMHGAITPIADVDFVALADAAGRVLAAHAYADVDQPAFDRSMMDGVAVRSADCAAAGAIIHVVGQAPAGAPWHGVVGQGQGVRVMTGGIVPPGANAVVPVERIAAVDDADTVRIEEVVIAEQHIARTGSEVRRGAIVVRAGSRLDGERLGVLAAFGVARPSVARRPRVGILPTGDEIVPAESIPGPGQVRDSNRWSLAALASSWGAEVVHEAVAADRKEAIGDAIGRIVDLVDVIVLSGGVSMGDYDHVASALARRGATTVFHRVKLRPGKPVLCARLGDTLVLGLPGNPVSSVVAAHLFLRPAIAALAGVSAPRWCRLSVDLVGDLPANGMRDAMLAARWCQGPHGLAVTPLQTAGSADLAAFAHGQVMIAQNAKAPAQSTGDRVDVLVWVEG